MNRMLINAIHKDEELRIAMAKGQSLYDLTIESQKANNKKSNVYKGKITRIEPSLEAAFVEYGSGRHGFLPLKEIARTCFHPGYNDNGRRPTINEVVQEGQELLVQVEKEERGNKGAALTTFITLPGCYLVLMPNNPRAGGVSRRIEGDERDEIHNVLNELTIPDGMGLIIRTAGGGRSIEELQWDLDILLRLWNVIQHAYQQNTAPALIYQEGNAVIRALRDYLRKDIDEILIDDVDVYTEVVEHLQLIRPDFVNRVKHYKDPTPLFTRFQIESQIESAFQREVRLPSGGAIIIDPTEALVSIDINSAKSTKGGDIEETALMTNLEAADEIARQLRLRDIGGLIVIDFIDMSPIRNQREVEERLKKALSMDRARVQIGRISRFGILEMSRQRLRTSLGESSRVTCPRCSGQGTIRGIESLGLSVIRIIEEEAMKENTAQVRAILPTEIAAYLTNEKRQAIIDIERRQNVSIIVVPSAHFLTPQYEVERVRISDMTEKDEKLASYKLALKPEVSSPPLLQANVSRSQEPAVKHLSLSDTPAPTPTATNRTEAAGSNKLKRFFSEMLSSIGELFTHIFEQKPAEEAKASTQSITTPSNYNRNNRRNNRNQRNPRHRNRRGNYRDRDSYDREPRDNRNEQRDTRASESRDNRNEQRERQEQRQQRDNARDKREQHAVAKDLVEHSPKAPQIESREVRQPEQPKERREKREPRQSREQHDASRTPSREAKPIDHRQNSAENRELNVNDAHDTSAVNETFTEAKTNTRSAGRDKNYNERNNPRQPRQERAERNPRDAQHKQAGAAARDKSHAPERRAPSAHGDSHSPAASAPQSDTIPDKAQAASKSATSKLEATPVAHEHSTTTMQNQSGTNYNATPALAKNAPVMTLPTTSNYHGTVAPLGSDAQRQSASADKSPNIESGATETNSSSTTTAVTQILQTVQEQTTGDSTVDAEHTPRKPRPRFRPHRHRRHAKRATTGRTNTNLVGEDIYNNKEKEN